MDGLQALRQEALYWKPGKKTFAATGCGFLTRDCTLETTTNNTNNTRNNSIFCINGTHALQKHERFVMQLQSLCRMQSPDDPYAAATEVQSKPRSGRPEHKQIGAIASALILGITLLFRNKQLTKVGRVLHMEVQQISTAGTGSLYSPQSTFEMPWTWSRSAPQFLVPLQRKKAS